MNIEKPDCQERLCQGGQGRSGESIEAMGRCLVVLGGVVLGLGVGWLIARGLGVV